MRVPRHIFRFIVSILVLFLAGCSQDRSRRSERYAVLMSIDGLSATYLDDPKAPIPTLRRLAREGARADGMITCFPSVTWPCHTSLITGAPPAKHGIIGNTVIDRRTGEQVVYTRDPVLDKDESVRVPTLYDVVHQAGMKTAGISWPATRGAKTLDWAIPAMDGDKILEYTTPGLVDLLDAAGISIRRLPQWSRMPREYSVMQDAVYAQITSYILAEKQPNLVIIRLRTVDAMQHYHGPSVEEAYWALSNADDRIREVWEALQRRPLAGRSSLFVVSDHGFAPVRRQIHPNALLRQLGLIEVNPGGELINRKAWVHSPRGASSAGVYVFDRDKLSEITAQLKTRLAELEGVDRVLDATEFTQLGLPHPDENTQQPDLMLAAESGYTFNDEYDAEEIVVPVVAGAFRGMHGHLPDHRFMHATFVAAGAHIRAGVKLEQISVLDVAPTMAAVLGVELPTAEGRILAEILR